MRHFGGPGGGAFWVHDLIWIAFWIAAAIAVVLVVRAITKGPVHHDTGASPAVRELEVRYARGEIGRDDYLQRRADLLGQSPPPAVTPAAAPEPPAPSSPPASPPPPA